VQLQEVPELGHRHLAQRGLVGDRRGEPRVLGETLERDQLAVREDAELAPTLPETSALARLAVKEFNHYELLNQRLVEMDAHPEDAMQPFVAAVDAFHERTAPSDWLEGLVKAYVGDGIATDFYREIAAYVDVSTRDLVNQVADASGHTEFVVPVIRNAIEQDPRIAGRLALWGRRLVGEALSQAQRVAADRDALTMLLVGGGSGRAGGDLAEIGRMFTRLTEAHTERMGRLGLTA
jgi:hypothetical protein